ncbi:MAG TPA: hypothetical protein VGD19_11285 [Allosphingosinicella sp.]
MKKLLPFLCLAGCAADSAPEPYSPVGSFAYGAISHDPFWMVAIGEDSIVLTLGPEGGRADGELTSVAYPRSLPREEGGVRRWQSGEGTQVIAIEARPGPCTTGGRSYEDRVRVKLSGRMLEGCGGRETGGSDG